MGKICSLLVTACLLPAIILANDGITVAVKTHAPVFDAIGPVITYTQIIKSSCLANKSFSAAITDIDGVNTTIGTRPRIYYKRSTDGNVWNNNTSSTDGWKFVEATNTTSPFNFVFDYNLLNFGSGISVGQIIEYFVVAQDLVATPNISINSGSFHTAQVSVHLTRTHITLGGCKNNRVVKTEPG